MAKVLPSTKVTSRFWVSPRSRTTWAPALPPLSASWRARHLPSDSKAVSESEKKKLAPAKSKISNAATIGGVGIAVSITRWMPACKIETPATHGCEGFAGHSRLAKFHLVFHRTAMQSHELLREVFQQCSPKQVAAEMGLSLSMIYKWAEPPDESAGSGSTNPLDRVEALLKCTQDRRLVQWVCQRAGGFFILNPKTNRPHPTYL